jgi:legumain
MSSFPPVHFNQTVFHAMRFGSGPIATTTIFTFDGACDATKPGSVQLSTPNATKLSPEMTFSEQFKTNPASQEWRSNVTFTADGKTVAGSALILAEQDLARVLEFQLGTMPDMTFLQPGPNPAPPPSPRPGVPTPAPSMPCQTIYEVDKCTKTCTWCSSEDGAHDLCFDTSSSKQLDTSKWTCKSEHDLQAEAGTCPGYPGAAYDTTQSAKSTTMTSYTDCCNACTSDDSCDHWTFQAGTCYTFPRVAGFIPELKHADASTYSGLAAHPVPPGVPTPGPSPKNPTPPPSPPPAPTAPTPSPEGMTNWAVIVTGSQGYGNYRHHADACHAYQIVRKNGIPKENIILMMQDNVANDKENPFPGQLFNKPTAAGEAGVDVYDGCFPDYTGSIVDAQLFMDVLTGNTAGNATKVLQSGPNDKVFVNFVDHGGGKIVAMPNGPFLTADVLNGALKTMHDKKMYDKLVFYMEACNSGSMFEDILTDDMNIYVTTAANPTEPSWGTYCPPQDMVNGKAINSCLGDLYSVNWMEDSDTKAGQAERLGDQFLKVKAETNKSHCMEYGATDFKWTDHASDYQGHGASLSATGEGGATDTATAVPKDAVDSRDIDLVRAFYSYLRATDPAAKTNKAAALSALVKHREEADARFSRVFAALPEALEATSDVSASSVTTCEHRIVDTAKRICGEWDSYTLKFTAPLMQKCHAHSHEHIESELRAACL